MVTALRKLNQDFFTMLHRSFWIIASALSVTMMSCDRSSSSMHAIISAQPGGTIDLWDDSASAVFIVKVDYESAGEIGTQQSKLVIDTMDFLESCRNDVGHLHGREISVEPIEEDDMHGSVYFLATHTPVHVKRIKISQGDSPNHVNVVMSYRLLYDQSGIAEDEDAQINASLELE